MPAFAFERGDYLYLVTPVTPFEPGEDELNELAFAGDLRSTSPNERLVWMRGQYVEGDRANANGALWLGKDLEIASLTPRLMPVTVMHDMRTAVGLIADTQLLKADAAAGVPRTRIDTTLALWAHRFPEVVEEAMHNHANGSLMQSMECISPRYACGECGQMFVKLPEGAERESWCEHLATESSTPVRRLMDVSFTGTGLIFGSRGARGALDTAHLDVLQDEVAEFHSNAKQPKPPTRTRTRSNTVEIDDKKYEELVAQATKVTDLEAKVESLEQVAAKVPELEKSVEKAEVDKKAAEDARDAEKAAREALEEVARATTLAGERTSKLGTAFTAKLPESVKTRLSEQAKVLSDEDWAARLDELAEMTGVKADEAAPEGGDDAEFTTDELAAAGIGKPQSATQEPSPIERRSVVSGLFKIV